MPTMTALVPIPRPRTPRRRLWRALGRFVGVAAMAMGRGSAKLGKAAASAYLAIDPDVRSHLAQLPILGMTMLTPRVGAVAPLPDDGHRPLVLVHGLGGGPGNFVGMMAYFRLLGRTRVYRVDLTGARSFDEMVGRLQEHVERVVECNRLGPNAQVDIVAHSMGGLVARLALQSPTIADRVDTLVTLGTPHSGTYLARFASTDVTLDLRPSSALQCALARGERGGFANDVRVVAYWSPADVIVLPAEGAQLAGAENVEMAGFTHYSYLIMPRCWRAVFDVLDRA